MPISTNLSRPPYYDDFNQGSDYYKILFQPHVSVQTRELNQLQSILQNQIEKFGDNIFATGTIVSGCNFNYYNPYEYIKLNDIDYDGDVVTPSKYLGFTIMNDTTGLRAWIIDFADGFETTAPDLKTLYLSYQNAGLSGNATAYGAGDVIRIFDSTMNGIEKITVAGGSTGFSNADRIIASSSLIMSVTAGSLSPGDFLINGLGANVEIVSVDSTTLLSSAQYIVTIKPRAADLVSSTTSTTNWTFVINQAVTNPAATLTASINNIIGTGLIGKINTNGIGTIQSIDVLEKGVGFTVLPYVTIQSVGSATSIYTALNLTPKNYISKAIISSGAGAVGQGYGFSVTEGVIFQKGYFLRVNPQGIIVSKYDTTPDNVAVGFNTTEQIINYNIDNNLVDNVNDTQNTQAPGADRLRLIPTLQLTDSVSAGANSQFFTISEWKEGQPFKQQQQTVYSIIGDDIATRVNDVSGNFVIDPWLVTTRSTAVANDEGQYVNIVIDPGTGYVNGYRIETHENYNINIEKGIDTTVANNHYTSLNYGNYVIVDNLGGTFQFNTGASVDLYDTAKYYANNITNAATLTSTGTLIGTANIRSLLHEDGTPGTPSATYRLYLFNILMSTAKNFADVKSIFHNGTKKGIADTVLTLNPTTDNSITVLEGVASDSLLFYSGVESLRNANNINYTYRTVNTTITIANAAPHLTLDLSSDPNESYPYTGTLTSPQLAEIIVVPTGVDLLMFAAGAGQARANTGNTELIGNASSTFIADYEVGDYVTIAANTGGQSDLRRIVNITNNTFMTVDKTLSYTNATSIAYRTFPSGIAIPFGSRSGLSGNCAADVLKLSVGAALTHSGTTTSTVDVNIQITTTTQGTKTPTRQRFVKLGCTSNPATTVGPWCLGVPDIFRLRGVYIGTTSVANTGANYVNSFYIDHNQNGDFYGLGYLFKKPNSSLTLTAANFLLVEFDYYTTSLTSGGFHDTVSYLPSNNNIFLNNSMSPTELIANGVVNSFEVPEAFLNDGTEIDLLRYFDFRIFAANTVAPNATYSSAPLDPANTVTLSSATELRFPVPDSQLYAGQIEYYLGRIDSVYVDKGGTFTVARGVSNTEFLSRSIPGAPDNSMKLVDISIPPYPNLPINRSINTSQIINNGTGNIKYLTTRIKDKTINNRGIMLGPNANANNVLPFNQPRNYTQADIGNLDRRLSDVEYFVQLSALEANLTAQIIPSSIDPALDRFKFGFFVDQFDSAAYSDLNNPQYAAVKEDVDVVPMKMRWDVSVFGAGPPDWIDSSIVDQLIATMGGVNDPLGQGPICAINQGNTVAYTTLFRNATDVLTSTNPGSNTDTVTLNFVSNTSLISTIQYLDTPLATWLAQHPDVARGDAVTLGTGAYSTDGHLYYVYDNIYGTIPTGTVATMPAGGTFVGTVYNPPIALYFYNYDLPAKIEIFQHGTLIATTDTANTASHTPSVLTDAEITLLTGAGGQQWFNDYPNYFMKPFVDTGSGFVTYAGKLTFNYNPNDGTDVIVRVTSPNSYRWKYVLAYPIDGKSIGCVPPQQYYNVPGGYSPAWQNWQYWCTNGVVISTGTNFVGYTQFWTPIAIPKPQTVIVPFDISADWAGGAAS